MNTDHQQKLEEERKVLMAQLGALGKRDTHTGDWEATAETFDPNESDDNNRADRFEDFEEKSALIKPLEIRLMELEKALAAMKAGTYGICRVCGKPIEEARLNANPAATTCMEHLEG